MKISVIIPAYNAGATLREALDSVQAQNHAPHEVIVVDDGSSDDTAEIARSYQEVLPLVLVQQANAGLGAARNAGMDKASGDAWAFLDADDVWGANKLGIAVRYLEKFPSVQWFYTPIFEWSPGDAGARMRERACPMIRTVEDFLAFNPIVPSTVIMRSAVSFRWEEDRELQEDAGAYLALFAKGVMPMKIPHCTTKYRLDFGMTADAEGHVDKVMRAVAKARELGHINDEQFALYEVRKAYELARTYKKRGDKAIQKRWKVEALRKAEGVEVPARLRWRLRFLI
jgi:glycosyltransferase involved in cell wall biosynthesis